MCKNNKIKIESGRSMVEMLGTLAIIGVLSIGGIAGYSYGMDKYRANQTINDVMLMGVDIITQLSQNRGTPTLSSDWGTKTTAGYDFTVVPNPEDETQYGIQITGVPSSVCKIVGDALKQTVDVYVGNEDYDSDTKEDPCDESDNNTMEFYFDTGAVESDGCKTDTECGEGRYCDNGWCFSGEKPVLTYGGQTCRIDTDCGDNGCVKCDGSCNLVDYHNNPCSIETANDGMCYWGKCIKKGCNDTIPCKNEDEYCSSPNTYSYSNCKAFKDGEEGVCVKPDYVLHKIDGVIYYVSNTRRPLWDANASCQVLGKQLNKNMGLISVSELVTNTDGSAWTNGTGAKKRTALAENLYNKVFGDGGFSSIWTSDNYDSCQAYTVGLSDGWVDTFGNYGNYFAVCR